MESNRNKRWRERHPEKERSHSDRYRRANLEARAAYMRRWNAKAKAENPEKYAADRRKSRLKAKYGITPGEYDAMLLAQGGHCAFCDRTPDQERHGSLRIDHCHETKRVRGLLCDKCNTALGQLGDTAKSIAKVMSYLAPGGV